MKIIERIEKLVRDHLNTTGEHPTECRMPRYLITEMASEIPMARVGIRGGQPTVLGLKLNEGGSTISVW